MTKGILGRKVGTTQIFHEDGTAIPVTVLEVGPCHVLQVKTVERDGYEAVQLGYLDKPRRLASRSERGQVAAISSKRSKALSAAGVEASAKPNCEPKRFIREFRNHAAAEIGSVITAAIFDEIQAVDVTGTSKGRGFSGVMKRHNFSGQRATHGVKKCHRHAGGTSMATYPGRVFKGQKMAGRYGGTRTTVRNLKVAKVDAENNLLLVRGAVPGPNGGFVIVRATNKVG
ncbi:50S ribosomal protein L3 [Aureliella helgolandensis]|uniref:Large ribosomal subunit protein uL3 n=1 Tax=Aureliella helgolandensis TaxID=2527968 RepID=A0A518G280_9BACT|nr:50S ribosomal protein L3 [Aureliella helgolandensis]QDV22645.1 50S ribosomal protein L3 [Aureliella helgolandensis]